MNNRFMKVCLLLAQLLLLGGLGVTFVWKIVQDPYLDLTFLFGSIRILLLILFVCIYYKTHLFSHNPGNPFIFIVTLFLTISEISLIPDALSTFGYYVPRTFVMRLWFASDFAISLLIIGYCLYFRLSDHNNTNRFMVIALVGAVLIAKIIPANQGLTYFRQSPYLYWFSNILVVITLISLILVTIEEHSSDEVIGHLALFFLELGRHFLSCFNGNISFYVCNGLYLVGMLFFLIMVIRKTFRL